MSTSTSVEELLTETLKQAGELAIPDDLHLPLQLDGQIREIHERPLVRAGGYSTRSWWIAVGGSAALVLVAVGLTVLLRSSHSITIDRTQLSAAQGEQLLCGAPSCVPVVHAAAGLPSRSSVENAGPANGAFQTIPSRAPLGTWIVAANGGFVQTVNESITAVHSVKQDKLGTVYLSAGDDRYYRYTTPGHGPLRVIGHTVHTVTLKDSGGRSYVLNLQTSELLPQQ